MSTRVILVRHGQSSFNKERRIQGRLDKSVLTEKGCTAANQVGAILGSIAFESAYCSPLQRAKQTAEIILSCFDTPPPLQATEQIMEIDLPLWAGMLRQDVLDKFPEDYRCWQEKPDKFSMVVSSNEGQIEYFPVLAVFESARRFWQDVLPRHNGGTILVVAHNGINRALIGTALGIPPAYYHSIQQSNCGITVLNFAPPLATGDLGAVQLESMNLTSHVGEIFPKPRENHHGPRLLLVRHGETDWNKAGKFQGQIDVPLNDNGREQSRRAAEFLKEVKLDFAISSSMLRPKETAEIILQHHPEIELQLNNELREISHGLWEGKFESEIEQSYPGLLDEWKTAPQNVQMPEGENLQQVWERAIAAWQKIVASASGTGIVVAHDAINKAILCHLFGLEPEHFWKFKQGNGAVTVIDYPNGPEGLPVLQAMNITTHLSGGILDKTAAGAL
ncbi:MULTISPECIES: histidine phosphatase family protein [Kamptonema]|uniref:histidine phosphatase family protein n=1 Tax=Kamptonema TaxID=1501433 RepID=UPI0004770403|nr:MULTISPECIES: histidine phosphatase family protein [Kamptonema]